MYPRTREHLARISGMVEKKVHEFGAALLAEIGTHLQTNPRQIFADDSFDTPGPVPGRARLGDTARQSLRRFRAGESVDQIASARLLATSTIYGHLAEALEAGEPFDLNQFLTVEEQREITAVFRKLGSLSLTPVFQALGQRYDYGKLRLLRAALNRQRSQPRV